MFYHSIVILISHFGGNKHRRAHSVCSRNIATTTHPPVLCYFYYSALLPLGGYQNRYIYIVDVFIFTMGDKRTGYERARKMIFNLPAGAELHSEALKKMILIHLSSDERNVVKTIKLMMDTGLIVSLDAERFRINASQ